MLAEYMTAVLAGALIAGLGCVVLRLAALSLKRSLNGR